MSWQKHLKALCVLLMSGGIVVLCAHVCRQPHHSNSQEQIVCVDTKEIIRLAAQMFARDSHATFYSPKKLEAYKDSLIRQLNAFGKINNYIVLSYHQVYGNVPDVTEDFVNFTKKELTP